MEREITESTARELIEALERIADALESMAGNYVEVEIEGEFAEKIQAMHDRETEH